VMARAVRLVEEAYAPARWTSGTRQPPAPPQRALTSPRLASASAYDAAGMTWSVPHALPASHFDSLSFTSHEYIQCPMHLLFPQMTLRNGKYSLIASLVV
jgi:hypothetical protein